MSGPERQVSCRYFGALLCDENQTQEALRIEDGHRGTRVAGGRMTTKAESSALVRNTQGSPASNSKLEPRRPE
ncbi:hypothetical protein CLCR_04478 [Cladophialophora carrionii]|uniref:Uncharacterized protein n=1 Tax=Cladophialophora carrionii TaxID=86049 RepID=A0A1C1CHP5_9EURO|nr:hypothetical protein CLCR_04478 [Cladophialophora carrionii]